MKSKRQFIISTYNVKKYFMFLEATCAWENMQKQNSPNHQVLYTFALISQKSYFFVEVCSEFERIMVKIEEVR